MGNASDNLSGTSHHIEAQTQKLFNKLGCCSRPLFDGWKSNLWSHFANVKPLGPNLIDILLNWISNGIYVTGIEGRKCGGDPIAIKMRLDKTRVITFWELLERPCNITGPPSLLDTRKILLEVLGSKREFCRHNPTASLPLKQRQRWPQHSKLHLRKPQVPQLC